MYAPRKNDFISACYAWYFGYIFSRDFSSFKYTKLAANPEKSILLLANRFSWWDGFCLYQLNKILFKKQFYMLTTGKDYQELKYYKYFGAFAPDGKGKDLIQTLQYAGTLLDNPKNLVLIFPQGKVQSGHTSTINFEKGVLQVINASKKSFQLVFSVILTDYFNKRKPEMEAYLANWQAEEYVSLQLLKSEFNKHYDNAILKQSEKAG